MPTEKSVNGAKLTLNPAPPAAPPNSAPVTAGEVTVTDALGRVIRLKKPSPLANLDFAKAAGSDRMNVLYLTEVAHLKFIASIDGAPVATPSTEGELRALYQRLGDEGNEAAQRAIVEHFISAAEQQAQETELKNS